MIKVSVIIPVFNSEEYIEQSIQSVLCQTVRELEVICIDDGSTDSSSQLIRNIQLEDARVVLFQQKNQGAGAARNTGLQKARGKYVAFLDADDYYIDSNALKIMIDLCERKDVPICASRKRCMVDNEKEQMKELFAEDINECVLQYKDYQNDYDYQSYLFLRKMLIENNILFPLYRRFQDPPFLVKASFIAEKFVMADVCLYAYRISNVAARYDVEKVCDLLQGLIDNLNFAKLHELDILFRNTVERLEYEFAYVIYKNVSTIDLRILKLLMKANQLINEKCALSDYIIRPIRIIVFCGTYLQNLLHKIDDQKEIALYGAGKLTRAFLNYLKKENLLRKVTTIVVSDIRGNVSQIEGIPVISLDEFLKNKNCFLLVTVGRQAAIGIEKSLLENGYANYELLDNPFGEEISWK